MPGIDVSAYFAYYRAWPNGTTWWLYLSTSPRDCVAEDDIETSTMIGLLGRSKKSYPCQEEVIDRMQKAGERPPGLATNVMPSFSPKI